MAKDYSEYDLHLCLVDNLDADGDIVEGYAIRSADLASFLIEYRALASKYGVSFEELLENDWETDSSASAASMLNMRAERGSKLDDTLEIEPTAARSERG